MSVVEPPCDNPDCDKCDPRPRWRIIRHRIQRITYTREIKAATPEEALQLFAAGTAWPSSYDDRYGEVVQQDDPIVTQITAEGNDRDARELAYYRDECCFRRNADIHREEIT